MASETWHRICLCEAYLKFPNLHLFFDGVVYMLDHLSKPDLEIYSIQLVWFYGIIGMRHDGYIYIYIFSSVGALARKEVDFSIHFLSWKIELLSL